MFSVISQFYSQLWVFLWPNEVFFRYWNMFWIAVCLVIAVLAAIDMERETDG